MSPKEKLESALNHAASVHGKALSELEVAEVIEEWAEGWAMRAGELREEERRRRDA